MATTIKYGGETVASIEAGQSATLKCANLKMTDDVVVETTIGGGAVKEPILEPLTVTENGTYEPRYTPVTEVWDTDTEYDFQLEIDGTPFQFKKSEKFVVPDDISGFDSDEYTLPFTSMDDGNGNVAAYVPVFFGTLYPVVVFVKTAAPLNLLYGTDKIEDNTAYITDMFEWTGAEAPWSFTGPGKQIDGYDTVTVDVQPYVQDLTVTENGTYTATYADYLRSVTVNYSQKEFTQLLNDNLVEPPVAVSTVKDYGFYDRQALKRVRLGRSCNLFQHAFDGCANLTKVWTDIYGENVMDLNSCFAYAFQNTGLSGYLRLICKTIRNYAFSGCTNLEVVDIWNEVSCELQSSAFRGCTNLKTVFLHPKHTTASNTNSMRLYGSTFLNCNSLETIVINGVLPRNCTLDISNGQGLPDSLRDIFVPASAVEAFKAAEGWSSYADKIKPHPTYSITFSGDPNGLQYAFDFGDGASYTWIDITEGMTISASDCIRFKHSVSTSMVRFYSKIGTSPGASDVTRVTDTSLAYAYPTKDETWYISASSKNWYETELEPVTADA